MEPKITVLARMKRGYATLADGTSFHYAPGDLMRMAGWTGAQVEISLTPGRDLIYPYRLTNVATGVWVVGRLGPTNP
jgi:hypothetical protein